jgi:hypothetical protein
MPTVQIFSEGKANKRVNRPKRLNETSSNRKLAQPLIELAKSGKEGLPPARLRISSADPEKEKKGGGNSDQ